MNLCVNGQSQVPPGFRFHPTEEELLHYYLRKKVASKKIDLDVIRDVDLNKLEPWDIQGTKKRIYRDLLVAICCFFFCSVYLFWGLFWTHIVTFFWGQKNAELDPLRRMIGTSLVTKIKSIQQELEQTVQLQLDFGRQRVGIKSFIATLKELEWGKL